MKRPNSHQQQAELPKHLVGLASFPGLTLDRLFTASIQQADEIQQRFASVVRDDSLDDNPHVVQMDDPTSPTIFMSTANAAPSATLTTTLPTPSTPSITVTVHEDKRGAAGDEDSEGESSSSDEDDYPDQV